MPLLILIAGGSCSGKTILAKKVAQAMTDSKVAICPMDNYYKDLSNSTSLEIDNHNFDHPDAIDIARLIFDIHRILRGETTDIPVYDFVKHCRNGLAEIVPGDFIIVEGLLALHYQELVELACTKIFIDCSNDTRLIRRASRDVAERGQTVEQILKQYEGTVEPMYRKIIEPSRVQADLVVQGDVDWDYSVGIIRRFLQNKLFAGVNIE